MTKKKVATKKPLKGRSVWGKIKSAAKWTAGAAALAALGIGGYYAHKAYKNSKKISEVPEQMIKDAVTAVGAELAPNKSYKKMMEEKFQNGPAPGKYIEPVRAPERKDGYWEAYLKMSKGLNNQPAADVERVTKEWKRRHPENQPYVPSGTYKPLDAKTRQENKIKRQQAKAQADSDDEYSNDFKEFKENGHGVKRRKLSTGRGVDTQYRPPPSTAASLKRGVLLSEKLKKNGEVSDWTKKAWNTKSQLSGVTPVGVVGGGFHVEGPEAYAFKKILKGTVGGSARSTPEQQRQTDERVRAENPKNPLLPENRHPVGTLSSPTDISNPHKAGTWLNKILKGKSVATTIMQHCPKSYGGTMTKKRLEHLVACKRCLGGKGAHLQDWMREALVNAHKYTNKR